MTIPKLLPHGLLRPDDRGQEVNHPEMFDRVRVVEGAGRWTSAREGRAESTLTMSLFQKRHYFMLSHSMGSGSSRIWTRRRRRQAAGLAWVAGWLTVGALVLATVPWMQSMRAGCTTSVVSALSD